ncbi:MAG: heme exporter protein CcmB [Hyphomicrobiaceae bacterium]|nr:heme exporter protein CcmB [Hyphomicrobiaceae bacterium]
MNGFGLLLLRDIRLALREGGAIGIALGFYLMVVALIPIAVGPELKIMGKIAPGILWVALLLSALLSLGRIFKADFEDGTLEIIATSSLPLELSAAAKSLAHWLTTSLPLAIVTPIVGALLNLDISAIPIIVLTMLVGTLAISFFGSIVAALTLQTQCGGVLIAVMVLPLYLPTLVYGTVTVSIALTPPGSPWPSFLLLCAISLASIVIGPCASAAALRHHMQ